jgi:hypothetical protein
MIYSKDRRISSAIENFRVRESRGLVIPDENGDAVHFNDLYLIDVDIKVGNLKEIPLEWIIYQDGIHEMYVIEHEILKPAVTDIQVGRGLVSSLASIRLTGVWIRRKEDYNHVKKLEDLRKRILKQAEDVLLERTATREELIMQNAQRERQKIEREKEKKLEALKKNPPKLIDPKDTDDFRRDFSNLIIED